jgi:FMN reductase
MALDLSNSNYGAETSFLDLCHTKLPIYDPEDTFQNNVQEVRDLVESADAFVLASPDYHGSMSGVMKNFLHTKKTRTYGGTSMCCLYTAFTLA